MNKKKVSVIVNFYNGEKYIENCINSILKQKYDNFEIILWDNNSSDNSKNIIRKFDDIRIKYYLNNKTEPLYKARNQAIKASNGEMIAFLDCDDWWENNYLSSREEFFSDPNIDFYYCGTNFFYEKSNKKKIYKKYFLPTGKIFSELSKDYFLIISGVIFKKEIFSKHGMFNENLDILGDYDFFMRISQYANAHSINSTLINYRVHEKNYSKLHKKTFYEEYKDWYNHNFKSNDIQFKANKYNFKKRLDYLELDYLLYEENKNIFLYKKILKHKDLLELVKFLILFFVPKRFYKILKK
jgi:glycosyltransferase involved in cell wall biosynthesis